MAVQCSEGITLKGTEHSTFSSVEDGSDGFRDSVQSPECQKEAQTRYTTTDRRSISLQHAVALCSSVHGFSGVTTPSPNVHHHIFLTYSSSTKTTATYKCN